MSSRRGSHKLKFRARLIRVENRKLRLTSSAVAVTMRLYRITIRNFALIRNRGCRFNSLPEV